jgi:tetratricopeptide (TPR) repeat protein
MLLPLALSLGLSACSHAGATPKAGSVEAAAVPPGEAAERSVEGKAPAAPESALADASPAVPKTSSPEATADATAEASAKLAAKAALERQIAFEKASRLRSDAFAALDGGDLQRARNLWSDAVALAPDDPHTPFALSNLGLVYAALGEMEPAVEHAARAAQLNPRSPALAVNLGITLEMAGLAPQAIAEYRRALELDPAFEPALLALGGWALGMQEPAEAVHHFRTVIGANPQSAEGHAGLAATLAAQGQWASAAKSMAQAFTLAQDVAVYAAAAGALHYRAAATEAAMELLDQALALAPHQTDALVLRAELAWRVGDYLLAQRHLDTAVAIERRDIDRAGAALRQGQLALELDQPATARSALELALRQADQPAQWLGQAHALLGAMALRERRHHEAQAEFARAFALLGQTPLVLAGLALSEHALALQAPIAGRAKALAAVESRYLQAVDMGEHGKRANARLRLHFAKLYLDLSDLVAPPLRRGKLHQAEIHIRRALAGDPGLVEAHLRLGGLLSELNRMSEAREHMRRAVALDPQSSRLRFLYANFLRRQGERMGNDAWTREAHVYFGHALQLDARYVPAQIGWYLTAAGRLPPEPDDGAWDEDRGPAAPGQSRQLLLGPGAQSGPGEEPEIIPLDPPYEDEHYPSDPANPHGEEIPPELEDLLPFLLMPEDDEMYPPEFAPDFEDDLGSDPDVIPIGEEDNNLLYKIHSPGGAR